MKRIQKHLTEKTPQGRDSYRKERKQQQNNTREVRSGMRTITGYKQRSGDCRGLG